MTLARQHETSARQGRESWFAAGGALSGLAAVIGASCCVLPLLLVNLGVGSAVIANLSLFAQARDWFLGAAVLFIAVALGYAIWSGRRPRRSFLALVALAAALTAGSWLLPYYEADVLRWLPLR